MGGKGSKSVKQNKDDTQEVFLKLVWGGDKEIAKKICDLFSNGADESKLFGVNTKLDMLLEKIDNNSEKTNLASGVFDVLDGITSLLDITKKVTDAVQIAGIAFGIVSTVLELVKGYREVDNLSRELYQELQQVADELKRLEGRKQTTRMKLDKDSRLSFNQTCTAVLKGYKFIKGFADQNKLKKFFTQSSNRNQLEEINKELKQSIIHLHSNLIINIMDDSPRILGLIKNEDCKEIWRSFDEIDYDQPTDLVVAKLEEYFKKNFPTEKTKWEQIKDRIIEDLDMDGNGRVHFDEINQFAAEGLKRKLELYITDPAYSKSKKVREARTELGKYIEWYDGIGDNKKVKSESFFPGTRADELQKIENWLKSKTNTVFCIRAAAGMGKSVLSYKLVTDHTKICIGYFFFDFSEEKRTSLRVAVTSILMQLAEKFPEVKTFLTNQLEGEAKRKSILESLDTLLNELLLGALRKIPTSDSNGYSYFLLFDALDELQQTHRKDLIKFFKKMEDASISHIKILVTSRPEVDIITEIKNSNLKLEYVDIHQDSETNRKDIHIFAKSIAEKYISKLQDADIQKELEESLVEKSQGVFLWMRFAEDWLSGLNSKSITSKDIKDNLPSGLKDTYILYFDRLFNNPDLNTKLMLFKIIKLILSTYEPLTSVQIFWILGKIPNNKWELIQFNSLLDSLQSIFPLNKGHYNPIHKTVSDFLKQLGDDYFFTKYQITDSFDSKTTHREISNVLISQLFKYNSTPSFFLPKVREIFYEINSIYPFPQDKQVTFLESWSEYLPAKEICDPSDMYLCFRYAIKYLLYHLKETNRTKEDQYLWDNILEYLYIKYSLNLVNVISDGQAIDSIFNQNLSTWLRYYHHIFAPTPFAVFQYACTHEPLRKLALSWGNRFNRTHNDKVAWMNLPLLESNCIQTLVGHADSVNFCAISPDSKWIVSYSYDKTLKIWNSTTGELLHTLSGHTEDLKCCVISPDGKWIVSGSEDKTLKIWNSTTGELLNTLNGHIFYVTCCAISPDGKWIVSGSVDNTLKIWNLTTGELLHTLSGHTSSVNCCAVSPDNKWIVSGSNDNTIKIWNSTTGELLHTLSGHIKKVTYCAVSPNNKWIVSGSEDKTLKIWNSTTAELLHTLPNCSNRCVISPDSKWILCGSFDNALQIWNTTTGELLHTLSGHTKEITYCAISLDNKWIVSGSNDKTIKIWNSTTGELLYTLSGHTNGVKCCAVSPDGKWTVSSSSDKTIKMWNLTTKKLPHTLSGHINGAHCCAVSPDGKWAVSGSRDKMLKIWNTTTGELLHTLSGHTEEVTCCAISPDGKWIVSGSEDKTLKIWNSTTGELLNTLSGHNSYVFCCAVSPDGKWIASGSWDNTLKIWNSTTGELLHTLTEHTECIQCCAVSPDGKWIVSGSNDKTLKIWNSTTGELLHTLSGHISYVTCCAISPDNKWIVSGSDDKTLKIWTLTTGELVYDLKCAVRDITVADGFCFAASDTTIYRINTANTNNSIDKKYYFFGTKTFSICCGISCVFQHHDGIYFPVFSNLNELEIAN